MGKSKTKIRKICIVTGNRSEYGKLKPIMRAIEKHPKLKLILIVMASHLLDDFGKTVNVIRSDGFKIDAVARTIAAGEDLISMAKSVGLCALEMPTLFNLYKPDIVFVSGDRFDIMGTAVSAAFMNIPVAHMEGGETTGSIDESIRHAITKLAHIHFPATAKSAERIIKMGEKSNMVFNVGSSCADTILSKKNRNQKIYKVDGGCSLNGNEPFLIVVQHPVTTEYEHCRQQIKETLNAISELKIRTVMLYPNVDAGSKDMVREIRIFRGELNHVYFCKHILFEDYILLLAKAVCIVGNSSSGIRESCYFGTPAVNVGTRQNGREGGKNVINVGYNKIEIKKAILKSIQHGKYPPEYTYGKGNASKKIVNILSTIKLDNIVQKKITI